MFFHSEKNQHNLRVATFIMFLSLVVERLISNTDFSYKSGEIFATLTLKPVDSVCVLVYFSVSVLLALKAKYVYLLIPDFFLLAAKLYTAGVSFYKVSVLHANYTDYEKFSYFAKGVECVLFSTFLILLFIGKLCHTSRAYSKQYPFVCIHLIVTCFPVTIVFEIIKVMIVYNNYKNSIALFFDFAANIVNEAFLDLPYLLLLLLMVFVPQNRYINK